MAVPLSLTLGECSYIGQTCSAKTYILKIRDDFYE